MRTESPFFSALPGAWAVLLLTAMLPIPALSAYPTDYMGYKIQAWAHGGPSFDYNKHPLPIGYVADEVQASGKANADGLQSYGLAGVLIDPVNGRMSAYAEANNTSDYDPHQNRWIWRVHGFGHAGMWVMDEMYLSIPAGTYAEPPVLRMDGRVVYRLWATGDYFSQAQFELGLNGPYDDRWIQQLWPAQGGLLLNGELTGVYPFQLDLRLWAAPHMTLTSPWTADIEIDIKLSGLRSGLHGRYRPWGDPGLYSAGHSRLDVVIDTLYVPPGSTLTTKSGLFLSNVPVIPEPQTWALMLAGLGLVGWAVRRRGQAR